MAPSASLIHSWLKPRADREAISWLDEKCSALKNGASDRIFFTTFSAVPRYFSKDDLQLTPADIEEAQSVRDGWSPAHWSISQAARTYVLLSTPSADGDTYVQRIERLASAADMGESVALFQSLALLRHPERFVTLASEGLRTNMTSVFNAVATLNPFPKEYFSREAWNQLVLKAVFVGTPLYKIQGLDERANPELARMLVDYAHERWAAGRDVTPELWRPVGRYAESEYLIDALEKALNEGNREEQSYAALALSESPASQAEELLATHPDLREKIDQGMIGWPTYDPLAENTAAAQA